jgi:hypothetical protein
LVVARTTNPRSTKVETLARGRGQGEGGLFFLLANFIFKSLWTTLRIDGAALSRSSFLKPPALPEVADCPAMQFLNSLDKFPENCENYPSVNLNQGFL